MSSFRHPQLDTSIPTDFHGVYKIPSHLKPAVAHNLYCVVSPPYRVVSRVKLAGPGRSNAAIAVTIHDSFRALQSHVYLFACERHHLQELSISVEFGSDNFLFIALVPHGSELEVSKDFAISEEIYPPVQIWLSTQILKAYFKRKSLGRLGVRAGSGVVIIGGVTRARTDSGVTPGAP
ncbi:hypothetical protein EVAR_37451_1 [Eumeta japonica]|uniref:Uncharacterized protein n=1 Tax=Eumeta variegata TaxID=151549 RepID=A0A4C1X6L1_EUMVA|nr:hypothetical protein EVAR_37451_1 [Eumeta japonica]